MNSPQVYDAKDFCKDGVSNWSSVEPEILECTDEMHNSMSILAEGIRKQSIDAIGVFDFLESVPNCTGAISEIENTTAISFIEFSKLTELMFLEASLPLAQAALHRFSVV